jgi:hypothetical protein
VAARHGVQTFGHGGKRQQTWSSQGYTHMVRIV